MRKAGFVVLMLGLFAGVIAVWELHSTKQGDRPLHVTLPPASRVGAAGVWKLHLANQGDDSPDITLDLKADGKILTGTVTGAPTPGAQHTIEKGKVEGEQISFEVLVKDPDGTPQKTTFTAKVNHNQIEGTAAVAPRGPIFPFTATRQVSGESPASNVVLAQEKANGRPPNPQGSNPIPKDAQQAILAAFDRYEVVGGLCPAEGNKDTDDFILALLRNPAFPDKVDDIAVEHGNALYQPLLDRFIAGEDVPFSEVRKVWRNTTQPPGGFAMLYEDLFPLVRRLNQKLPAGKKLRVLACDPPVDWSKVKNAGDMKPFEGRDKYIASVMEREVLSKHRKALLLIGVNHMKHGTGGAVGIYEAKYPNVTFVIAAHVGFGNGNPLLARYNDELEKRMVSWPIPSLVTMKGTWLADLSSAYFAYQDDGHGSRGDRGIDGYLYLGPRDLLLSQPLPARIALDEEYMEELRRRATILHAPMRPEAVLQQELGSSVFTYAHAEIKKEPNRQSK